MGRTAKEAPGGTGAEVRGDAETLRAGNCPHSRSGEGARAACATRKASPPKDGWRPQRRARGSEHGRRSTFVRIDRKSTRLNSSHLVISYAVFCLKKKKKKIECSVAKDTRVGDTQISILVETRHCD